MGVWLDLPSARTKPAAGPQLPGRRLSLGGAAAPGLPAPAIRNPDHRARLFFLPFGSLPNEPEPGTKCRSARHATCSTSLRSDNHTGVWLGLRSSNSSAAAAAAAI